MELPVSLPDLASLLAKLGATEHDPEGSGIAELYLEIFSNSPKTRLLLEASSVPLCFNFEVISALLPEENITSEDMHIFLSSKILKEDNDLTLPYRRLPDLIRRALRKHLAKENYDFFSKISFRAYHFFQADVSYQAEAFYHGLIANPYETVEHISDAYYALEQAKQDLSIRKIGMTLEPVLNYPIAVKSKPHGKPQTLPIRCQRRRMGVRRTVPDPVPPGRRAAQTLTARGIQRRALCGALWLPMAHAAQ